jgi:hypothetical protein
MAWLAVKLSYQVSPELKTKKSDRACSRSATVTVCGALAEFTGIAWNTLQ